MWLRPYATVSEAIAALLAPHAEVAAHDLRTGRIVALWNPISGRAVGDDSLIGELPEDPSSAPVIGPYPKVLPDGRGCSSVSVVLTDESGRPRGLLCVNLDRSPLDQLASVASAMFLARSDRPPALFERDWRERMAQRIHEFCLERGIRREHLDRGARRELVSILDGEGLFAVRRAADLAAQALGVSRATVYTMLKEARS